MTVITHLDIGNEESILNHSFTLHKHVRRSFSAGINILKIMYSEIGTN